MGNWKLGRWQEAQDAHAECCARCATAGRPGCRAGADPPLARRRRRPVAARGHRRHARLPVAQPGRAASAARSPSATRRTVTATTRRARDHPSTALPGLLLEARAYVQLIDPARGFSDGTSPDGDGETTNVRPSTSAARTWAASPTSAPRQLLVRVRLPRLALRPPGRQGPRAGPGAAGMDRFAHSGRGRRADRRHLAHHPRPAARRARPAGPHPGPLAAGLHLSDERTGRELTPRPRRSRARSRRASRRCRSRHDRRRWSASTPATGPHRRADRGARRADRAQSGNARMVAFLGALFLVLFIPLYWIYDIGLPVPRRRGPDGGRGSSSTSPTWRAATSSTWPTARAATATTAGRHRPAAQRPGQALQQALTPQGLPGTGHLNPDYLADVLRRRRSLRLRRPEQPHAGLGAGRAAQLPRDRGDHRLHAPPATTSAGSASRGAPRAGRDAPPSRVPRLARPGLRAAARRHAGARLLARAGRHACARHARSRSRARAPREPARDRDRRHRADPVGRPGDGRADHLDHRRRGRDDRVPDHQQQRLRAAQLPHRLADELSTAPRRRRPARASARSPRRTQTFTTPSRTCPTSRSSRAPCPATTSRCTATS
jgi:hypothetical protein